MTAVANRPDAATVLRADLNAAHARLERIEARLPDAAPAKPRALERVDPVSLEVAVSARVVARRRRVVREAYQNQVQRALRLLRAEYWLHWLRVRFLGLEAAVAWLVARGDAAQVQTADGLCFVLRVRGGST